MKKESVQCSAVQCRSRFLVQFNVLGVGAAADNQPCKDKGKRVGTDREAGRQGLHRQTE